MQAHTTILIKSRGYDKDYPIPCEMCMDICTEVHHIEDSFRGKRNNSPDNLIALCRNCHKLTHDKRDQVSKDTHINKVQYILNNPEDWKEECRSAWYYF